MALKLPPHTLRRLQAHAEQQAVQFGAFSGYGHDGGPLSPMGGRWMASPRSPDADTLRALPRQRAESRELVATNPIATGAIGTNINRVVGTGLQPVFQPDVTVLGWSEDQATAWSAQVAREFSLWADSTDCDWEGQQNFFERQALVLGSRLTSGDCFSLLPDAQAATPLQPYRLRLQLLEADRVGNPSGSTDTDTVVAGVKRMAGTGQAEYHVYARHPGGTSLKGDRFAGTWYTAIGRSGRRRILHHFRPTRPEQTRGVPYLAPVIQTIRDLGRFTEAEITAAIINSFFTTFIETEGGAGPAPVFGVQAGQGSGAAGDEIQLAPGAVIGLIKGEKISVADPKRPNPNAEGFILGMLKLIGMGLGIPFEVLLKQFNSSFSASKAALLDAWMHFRTERSWLVNSFCQPVVETWLAEAVAIGRISAPGFFADPLMRWAYTRCAWHGDSQGSINPKDEVEAYTAAIEQRLMTRERAEWELFGSDYTRTYPTKLREQHQLVEDEMLPPAKAGAAAAPKSSAQIAADQAAEQKAKDQKADDKKQADQKAAEQDQAARSAAQQEAAERAAERELVRQTEAKRHDEAMAAQAAHTATLQALAARPTVVTVEPAQVSVHLPEGLVQLEATVQPATVNVAAPAVTVQAGDVHVQTPAPTPMRQVIERDEAGEIAAVTMVPVSEVLQ